jgi:hypothetical protein
MSPGVKRWSRLIGIPAVVVIAGAAFWTSWDIFLRSALDRWVQGYVDQAVDRALSRQGPLLTRDDVVEALDQWYWYNARNIPRRAQEVALDDSARYVLEHMGKAPNFPTREALFDFSLEQIPTELRTRGLYCEFGVLNGVSLNYLADKAPERTWHGFDSFEGLPGDWRTGFPRGSFTADGLPKVRSNVQLHKGWFNKSVPVWAKEHSGPLAFVHFDADMYESTKDVLDVLADRFVPGTVVQFDEYLCYPGFRSLGEFRAWQEFVTAHQVKYEYLGYMQRDEQVSVRVVNVGGKKGQTGP